MKRVRQWVVAALLAISRAAAAQEPPAAPAAIEAILVAGDAVAPTEERAPSTFATVLDTARYADHVKTVGDALAETAGTQVRRFGGLGAFSTVSIRGSASNQVQIYLDGVPLSRARNETVNLADLPLDSLARIEVYRGQSPAGFGAGAIGGVVHLVTAPPTEEPTSEVRLAYGSFATRKLVASHSRRARGIDVLAHVSYLGSDGDFTFKERATAPGTPPTLVSTRRRNNELESVSGLVKAGADVRNDLRVDLTSEAFYKDQGVPGIGRSQSATASLRDVRSLNYATLTHSGAFGRAIDVTGRGFAIFERQNFANRSGDLFGVKQDVTNDTAVVGAGIEARDLSYERHLPSVSAEVVREGFSGRDALRRYADTTPQRRLRLGLIAQEQFAFLADRLLLIPTLRYERLQDSFGPFIGELGREDLPRTTRTRDLWGPSFGAQWRASDWLRLRGNIGRFERAPNLDELFGNRGFIQGNPRLRPEEGINRDVGFHAAWRDLGVIDNLSAEYAYFNNDIDDLIVLVQLSQQFFRPENVGSARVRGHEVSVHTALLKHVSLDANYTRQDARNLGAAPSQRGRRLPGRPRDELYARLGLERGCWSTHYEINVIAGNYLDRVNFRRVASRELHAVGVAFTPRPGLRLGVEVQNIGDEQAEDVAGFPLPGRTIFGTIKVNL